MKDGMKGKELAELLLSGSRPVVVFKAPILDSEGYLEPGMRGRLVAVSNMREDTFKLHVDLSEFDEFNRQFESANYYDKSGVPRLTAREAGYYSGPEETLYVGLQDNVDFCEAEEPARLELYADYCKAADGAASGLTYTQWLEDRVIASQSR